MTTEQFNQILREQQESEQWQKHFAEESARRTAMLQNSLANLQDILRKTEEAKKALQKETDKLFLDAAKRYQ